MISLQTRNVYSEIFELLKHIDKNDLNRVPMDVLIVIKENRNVEYVPNIDFENINDSLSKRARAFYVWLYTTYMVQDKAEKDRIKKILYDNEMEKNKNISYDIFNKNKEKKNNKKDKELVLYKKESFIKKIINKIKEIFKK